MTGPAADDAQLLERYVRSRDEPAFAEVVRRHVGAVYAAAVRRVGDRHLAEDVAQAVFVILARKAASAARSPGPLSGWLLRAVRYAAANAVKADRRRRRHETAAASAAASRQAAGGDACSPNPADVLVWREVAGRLDDAVLRLPTTDRRAVLLRYFERRSIREVADALGTTEAAAKQRLSRSVAKLRDRLDRGGRCLGFAGTGGLAAMLAAQAVRAAPPALTAAASSAPSVAAGTGGSAAALSIAKGAMTMMGANAKLAAAVAATIVVGAGVVVTASRAANPAGNPPAAVTPAPAAAPTAAAALRTLAEARAKAADAIVADMGKQEGLGEPVTPGHLLTKGAAQRLAADARIDAAAGDPAAQVRVAEQYLTQCKLTAGRLKARFDSGLDGSRVPVLQAEQQVAEAEYLVAKLKSQR